eukprot:1204496-Amphidinium_carterae.1
MHTATYSIVCRFSELSCEGPCLEQTASGTNKLLKEPLTSDWQTNKSCKSHIWFGGHVTNATTALFLVLDRAPSWVGAPVVPGSPALFGFTQFAGIGEENRWQRLLRPPSNPLPLFGLYLAAEYGYPL